MHDNGNQVNLANKTKKIMDIVLKRLEADRDLNPITMMATLRLLSIGMDIMASEIAMKFNKVGKDGK